MQTQTGGTLTYSLSYWAILPVIAVLIPLLGALAVVLLRKRERIRNAVALGATVLSTAAIVFMYRPVVQGIQIGDNVYKSLEFMLPVLLKPGVGLRVDATSFIFALITGLVWSLALIYSLSYIEKERAQTSYYVFCLLTLAANLGVVLTKDFFSLYLFFEALAFFSYMLFIHNRRGERSFAAGRLYLYLSIAGGLCLLMGFLLIYHFTGSMNIEPMGKLLSEAAPGYIKYVIVLLMITGFGVKAGIFFLHVWMPEAYSVAPSPVCAMSSGAMIKAGAYGILRTVNTLFAPTAAMAVNQFTMSSIGYIVILIGIITMFGGMINALLSKDCKRLLAYSSVSQMGYIVLGLGLAVYLGRDGVMGLAGSLYHVINHAFFKSALFLAIGVVYFRTRQLDMDKLGGLWRNMPLTALVCFIAVLGISGIPGFSGFASKAILHEAIVEASARAATLPPFYRMDMLLRIAEVVFLISAAGTFCYSLKLFISVFLSKRPSELKHIQPATMSMKIALLPLAVLVLWTGLKPNFVLEKLVGPALAYFGFNPSSHSYQALFNLGAAPGALRSSLPILYDPKTLSILGSPQVMHNLFLVGIEILGGALLFVIGYRLGLFRVKAPEWMGTKYWYLRFADGFLDLIQLIYVVKKKFSSVSLRFLGSSAMGQEREWVLKQLEVEEALEDDKTSAIREAIKQANIEMTRKGIPSEVKSKKAAEIRKQVGRESAHILQLKKEIMKEAILALEKAKISLTRRSQKLSEIMGPVAGLMQSTGNQGLEDLRQTIKRYNDKLTINPELETGSILLGIISDEKVEKRMNASVETRQKRDELIEKYQRIDTEESRPGKPIHKRFSQWLVSMIRILAEIFAGERVPWRLEELLAQRQIDHTRNTIRTYTRDININVIILLGLFIIIATILLAKVFLSI